MDFTGSSITRVDPQVNFEWGDGSPHHAIAPDTFSARWTGQVQAQKSETYTFYAKADDGVRLWVNGQLLINQWKDQGPTEYSGSIALTAGQKYDIKVEYYENSLGAVVQMSWSSATTPKQIIPQSQLYSTPTAQPTPTPAPQPTPTPAPGGPVLGSGNGLSVTYYNNMDFTGSSITRVDPQINFEWSDGSPNAAIAPDTFSARWTGQVQAQKAKLTPFTPAQMMACACGLTVSC
jgi:hypothetical protein